MPIDAWLLHGLDCLFDALARSSIQGGLFVLAVWALCRLVPRLPAGARTGLWWLACAGLVLGLVWLEPVRVPVLPPERPPVPIDLSPSTGALALSSGTLPIESSVPADPAPDSTRAMGVALAGRPADASDRSSVGSSARPWKAVAAACWGLGVLVLLGRAVRDLARERALVGRSDRVWPDASPALADLHARLGLARCPEVRASAEVATPRLIWAGRAVVLLPAAALARQSAADLAMSFCHELVHIRRRDLWWGWMAVVAERLFFFHPLARLAAREYLVNREGACDAEVVRALGAMPRDYGRLLVSLGVARQRSGLAAASASTSLVTLKRRLQMLQHVSPSGRPSSRWWRLVPIVALAGVVPIQLVARGAEAGGTPSLIDLVRAAYAGQSSQPAPPAPPRPPAAPEAPPLPPDGSNAAEPGNVPLPPVPPVPPEPLEPMVPAGAGFAFSFGDTASGESWVYVSADGSTTMHGAWRDAERVKRLRSNGAPLFWFVRNGKEYIVRDPKVLQDIDAMLAPQRKLGAQQGDLGARQGELGAQQGGLGAQQGELGAQQGRLGAEQAKLAAEQARIAADRIHQELDRSEKSEKRDFSAREAELHSQMEALGREMEALGRQQEELGRKQEALGRQQEELGRQQEALGRQQEELSRRIETELRGLIDRAIASGTAQPVK